MLNGESEKLLKRGLTEHDLRYIENAHPFIQRSIDNGHQEQANIILRDIGQLREKAAPQPTGQGEGFRAMLTAALGSESTEPPEPETREPSGFSAMLSASTKGKKTDVVERQNESFTVIQRHLSPIDFEYQLPQICNDTCFIKRHCGAYPSQVGSLCVKQSEQYRNDKFIGK